MFATAQSQFLAGRWYALVVLLAACGSQKQKEEPLPHTTQRPSSVRPAPTRPKPPPQPRALNRRFVLGATHACLLGRENHTYCWGGNQFAELGQKGVPEEPLAHLMAPQRIDADLAFASLSSGFFHTCAQTTTGNAYCWGQNAFLQIREPPRTSIHEPTKLTWAAKEELQVVQVATGSEHTCVLDREGRVRCRGSNQYQQLGAQKDGRLDWDKRILWLAAGRHHTCAIDEDADVLCWGDNVDGQLGKAPSPAQAEPHKTATLNWPETIAALQCGSRHCCTLQKNPDPRRNGKLQAICWGNNSTDQLGVPATKFVSGKPYSAGVLVPKSIIGDRGWLQIAPGGRFTCGLTDQGQVICWGDNHDFILGTEEELDQLPKQIALPGKALELAVGPRTACAWVQAEVRAEVQADAGADLYCWGANRRGLLGLEPDDPLAMPQKVSVPKNLYSP